MDGEHAVACFLIWEGAASGREARVSRFDTQVDRAGTGSLKLLMMPERLTKAGLVSYWGAEFDFPPARILRGGRAARTGGCLPIPSRTTSITGG